MINRNKQSISIIMLTKNSASHIKEALASVSWADEIIIVDSGSTDHTLHICREFTNKITITPDWPGFGVQKNRALAKATQDWVLELDSDEIVDPALARKIQHLLVNPKHDGYKIKIIACFLDQKIRFSGWTKYKLRLFRRNQGQYDNSIVHEHLIYKGTSSGTLHQPICNHTCDHIEQLLDKSKNYILSGAAKRYARGKRSGLGKALLKALLRAFKSYVLYLGFLDGRAGLMIAVGNFYQTFYIHAQLYYLQHNPQRKHGVQARHSEQNKPSGSKAP